MNVKKTSVYLTFITAVNGVTAEFGKNCTLPKRASDSANLEASLNELNIFQTIVLTKRHQYNAKELASILNTAMSFADYAKHDKPITSWLIPHGCNKG